MGLAPYGEPRYADLISDKLIKIADDGSFQLDMSYFDYATGLTMTNEKFHSLFGAPHGLRDTIINVKWISPHLFRRLPKMYNKIAKNIAPKLEIKTFVWQVV